MKHTHITPRRLGAFLLIASISGAAAYVAHAQSDKTSTSEWETDLFLLLGELEQLRYEGDKPNGVKTKKEAVAGLIQGAIANRERTAILSRNWHNDSKSLVESSAFTVLQNQKLIEQNAEIIALLKAKK